MPSERGQEAQYASILIRHLHISVLILRMFPRCTLRRNRLSVADAGLPQDLRRSHQPEPMLASTSPPSSSLDTYMAQLRLPKTLIFSA